MINTQRYMSKLTHSLKHYPTTFKTPMSEDMEIDSLVPWHSYLHPILQENVSTRKSMDFDLRACQF